MSTIHLEKTNSPSVLVGAAVAVLLAMPLSAGYAQDGEPAGNVSLPPELETVRTALDKYQDPIAAVHDGYLSTVGCLDYPEGSSEGTMNYVPGGMGVHFLNLQLVGPELDPMKPQVLIYEPDGGKLRLAAAEWFMPVAVAGSKRPTIFGKELEGPMEGHEPLMPKGMHHYDLHVWLWKANPAGVFSPTNPAMKCPPGGYSFEGKAPHMVGDKSH